MDNLSLFEASVQHVKAQGRNPDAWWIGGNVETIRTEDGWQSWSEGELLYGLPMKKSFKLKPGEVVLAEGGELLVLFGAPCALDLTHGVEQAQPQSEK
jgi:hypothetical protein